MLAGHINISREHARHDHAQYKLAALLPLPFLRCEIFCDPAAYFSSITGSAAVEETPLVCSAEDNGSVVTDDDIKRPSPLKGTKVLYHWPQPIPGVRR